MYCNIVKLGVYVYHTRDMWMGPDRRCETGFFFFLVFFMAHTVFFSSPFSFFVQYILLRYRPSTVVASDGKTDSCTVDIILGYDAEASLGREINKISWNWYKITVMWPGGVMHANKTHISIWMLFGSHSGTYLTAKISQIRENYSSTKKGA